MLGFCVFITTSHCAEAEAERDEGKKVGKYQDDAMMEEAQDKAYFQAQGNNTHEHVSPLEIFMSVFAAYLQIKIEKSQDHLQRNQNYIIFTCKHKPTL